MKSRSKKKESRKKATQKIPNLVSPKAKIGKNVSIWNYAYVGGDSVIGDNTKVGSLAHVDYNVQVGSNCKIEGLAYLAPMSRIGNNVFIGPAAVLTNDPYPLSDKMIGVTVEDGAIICARAVIKAGVRVGKNSVVAMGSVVTKDVPPDTVVLGVPARPVYSREFYEAKRRDWNSSP
ncbi:MAG TPA: acyltransferase [Nitrososphaerales archaeon]|nr:acyltransferase [Nitrososphaerales archaeon]